MTTHTIAGARAKTMTATERLAKIETLQREVDEARLQVERIKSAAKKAKEDLEEVMFQLRRVSLNLPEDQPKDDDGAPLFDKTTGEVLD